tara:strand:+ start:2031 stop:2669 length:639 start_codon:yes stop_codon:yes gene_type:complete
MFDGGGRGQAGPRFEGGGILSAAANAVARPAGSRERGDPDMRTGVGGFARDMVDGGGFNRSGPTFQGGPFGGLFGALLNSAGVRPMGYMDRLGSVRPQMRPQRPTLPAYMQPPAPPTLAGQPNYADRFAVPPTLAGQPNYADRFAVPFQAQPVVTPPVGRTVLPPAGAMSIEQWMATTFSDGMPSGITQETLADSYQMYLNNLEQLGPRYGN